MINGNSPLLRCTAGALATASVLAMTSAAYAQGTTAAGTNTSDGAGGIETVIVTAQRRAEDQQKTSLSMTALKGSDLVNAGVHDQTDLQFASPSLSISTSDFAAFPNIRGIGLSLLSPTVVSGVALYRDGLFYPGNILADEPYYDIADVEVLRGPQGTFVGQNSTGGAILVTSNNPNFDGLSGRIEGWGGNYTDVGVRGAVNLPVSDTVAARIAFNHESRDSFFKVAGSSLLHPGKLDMSNVRVGLLWQPSTALSVLWKTEYNTNSTDGQAQRPIPGTNYAGLASPDLFTLTYDRNDVRNDETSFRTGLEVKYIFPNGIEFRSMSGFQYAQLNMLYDQDATAAPTTAAPALPGVYQPWFVRERVLTQEFNLISPDKGWFRWVVGATYVHRSVPVNFTIYDQFAGAPAFPTLAVNINGPTDNYGAFGQATFEMTPSLELQGGVRYSHDWLGSQGTVVIPPAGNLTLPNNASYSDGKVTGKIGLNWTADDNNFLYVFAAKGYKSGGPNTASPVGFAPESVWDYEAGWKSNLLAHHLTAQIDGFYMDYDNFQDSALNPFTTNNSVINLNGASKIYGVELQAQGRIDRWMFNINAAYVHSQMASATLIDTRFLPPGALGPQCPAGTPSNPPVCFDYTPYYRSVASSQNPLSPEYTFNFGVQYSFEIDGGVLTPRLDFSYMSSQYTTIFNDPKFDKLSDRRLLGGQISYAKGPWEVSLYGTNLTNQTYAAGQSGDNEFIGAPRQYGIRVSRSF